MIFMLRFLKGRYRRTASPTIRSAFSCFSDSWSLDGLLHVRKVCSQSMAKGGSTPSASYSPSIGGGVARIVQAFGIAGLGVGVSNLKQTWWGPLLFVACTI